MSEGERSTGEEAKGVAQVEYLPEQLQPAAWRGRPVGLWFLQHPGLIDYFYTLFFNCLILLKVCRDDNTPLLLGQLAGDAEII